MGQIIAGCCDMYRMYIVIGDVKQSLGFYSGFACTDEESEVLSSESDSLTRPSNGLGESRHTETTMSTINKMPVTRKQKRPKENQRRLDHQTVKGMG